MAATPFVLVFHNHQPVGNLPWVIEECYRTAYLPFLELLEHHPRMRVGLHFTGPLLDWLRQEHPDYLARIHALVTADQVEVLGGGYYEPILPVIPERDRAGQLRLLREVVAHEFGAVPTGAWLAERVWEPGLPGVLHAEGVQYVLIDDEVFHRLGYSEQQTSGIFITEDDGKRVRLLPISRRLRYTLPTQPVPKVMETLREMAATGAEALIYAEDGERYGSWPGTYDFLYGSEAYLDQFFTALAEADDLQLTLPRELARDLSPRSLVYLPPTSYAEMLEWSGGLWRNFLSRYRESNLMHKKMLAVSRWVEDAARAGYDVREAQRHLYAGQCNCAYWYGVFGGIYFPHLRRAIYEHLLQAERAVVSLLPPEVRGACEVTDHDCDGYDEIMLRAGDLSVGLAPAQGGAVFTLEHLGAAHNFLNTMSRYPLRCDGEETQEALPVDWYPRLAFLDHFLAPEASPESVRDMQYEELGDFVQGNYEVVSAEPGDVLLCRRGNLRHGAKSLPLQIKKRFICTPESLTVRYDLTNLAAELQTIRFAVEVDAGLSAANAPDRVLTINYDKGSVDASLAETRACTDISGVCYRDRWLKLALDIHWSQTTPCWMLPIYTPLRSMNGLEWIYQNTIVLPIWKMKLQPGEQWQVSIDARIAAGVGSSTMSVAL